MSSDRSVQVLCVPQLVLSYIAQQVDSFLAIRNLPMIYERMRNEIPMEWVYKAFCAFGHPFRRELLFLLDDSEDDTVEIDHVSNCVATMRDITTDQIRIELLHVHLPKLPAVEFIEYAIRSGTIRYQDNEFSEAVLSSGLLSVTE